jgi:hypothetical protein
VRQRPADPVIASADAYQTARRWISECFVSHDGCPGGLSAGSYLPTRVLDLSDFDAGRVKLHVSQGEKAQYAALSYCWGQTPQLTTTGETLKHSVQEGIKIEELPKTLQDALYTTKQLGIPYLWIDSLCIIQDSFEDKSAEITRMPQIYKNAVVTLSAAIAPDCGQGFLEDRQEVRRRVQSAFRLPLLPDDEALYVDTPAIGEVFLCLDQDLGFNIKDFADEPINKRAWTLQESWLSPRLLIYGSGPLKWQCLSKSITHGDESPRIDSFESDFRGRSKFFTSRDLAQGDIDPQLQLTYTSEQREVLLTEWKHLVYLYTRRSLSFADDKLPALSGIAAEFHRLSGDTYLAGLWKSSLPWGLLWHRLSGHADQSHSDRSPKPSFWKRLSKLFRRNKSSPHPVLDYHSPSWSFATTSGPVTFESPLYLERTTQVVIHSSSTTPETTLAPFGRVTGGKLTLTGPMRRMEWPEVTARYVIETEGNPHIYWDYIIPDGGAANPHFMKAAKSGRARPNTQYLIRDKLISKADAESAQSKPTMRRIPPQASGSPGPGHRVGNQSGQSFWFLELTWNDTPTGLVLVDAGDGTYKRTGFFMMGRNNDPEDLWVNGVHISGRREWDWDRGLEMRTITIV